jgi:predicted O-linked N-acetylglucosamine transferase (SPINDLY family)
MNRKARRQALANARSNSSPSQDARIASDFREAVLSLQAGRLDESEMAHRRVLSKSPRHAPSLHHMGLIAFKRNAPAEAVDWIRRSVAAEPKYHQAWLNLAVVLGDLRRSDEAIDAARECLALQPQNAGAHAVLGNLMRVARRNADAIEAYTRSLQLKPDQPDVLARLGDLALQAGNLAEAREHCRRALALDPNNDVAGSLERRILASGAPVQAAEARIEATAKTAAERARSLDDLGAILRAQHRYEEAVDICRKVVALEPDNPDWLFNLALALEGAGRKEEALTCYQAGLAIDPNRAEAYANVGCLLKGMNMHKGAIQALEHAITLDPGLAMAHYNLATIFKQTDRLEEAMASFRRSVECAPEALANRFELCSMRRLICDWDGLDEEEERCLELFRTKQVCIAPFQFVSMRSSRADQLEANRRYAKLVAVPQAMRFTHHRDEARPDRRIRIGFLSSDFFEHATAMLLVEVLESMDRGRFGLFAYCYSPDDGTALKRRIVEAFDRYVPIGALSDLEAAKTIYEDGIDILVELKGYTRDARSGISSYKPAPVQVNYLGYPTTMGADFIDYVLADRIVAPALHQEHYSERIVHLPNCYQPNDRKREIDDTPVSRADFGLPEDAFVFCSFNNSYKLNAATFDVWMRLIQNVPGSVLWLLAPDGICRENLRSEAVKRNVDSDRLVFARRLPVPKHLSRHRLADLFLDSVPCNAHTTASDALWAGPPVLTCAGDTFAGRVAASLLNAMNLPELITHNLEEYAQAAMTLASDKSRLDAIRSKIAERKAQAPLFDTVRYTRNLERAFETMVDITRAGEAPRSFAVEDVGAG